MTTKAELVAAIADAAGISKAQAQTALDKVTTVLADDLKKDGRAAVAGFGTFTVSKRAARTGKNPQTGEAIKIKASKSVRFKPSPGLKETVQKFKG